MEVLKPNGLSDADKNDILKSVRWEPPGFGWVKINCDEAYTDNPPSPGIGVVTRDDNGQLIGVGKHINGNPSLEA